MGKHVSTQEGAGAHSRNQIVSGVKVLLNAISDSMFAYDEEQKGIDFDIALVCLSNEDLDRIISSIATLCNSDATASKETLAVILDHCYRTIPNLKKIPKYGNVYFQIIDRYYVNKLYDNIEDAIDDIDGAGSRATFFRRFNEACLQLHRIWFSYAPDYYRLVLNEIIQNL